MKILIKNLQRRRRLNKAKIIRSVGKILSLLAQPDAELSILFIGDRRMLRLNAAYRGKLKSTDVLSFEADIPFRERDQPPVLGDIVISVPKAESQAEKAGATFYDEVNRLLIHGTLHLLKHDHEGSVYKARLMRKKEKEIFNALKKVV
ncbi:MAG: rRNA maturation RNase YbeY [Nitrospirae bacterium]|nr:rRNA maturation RNase YbeY [Nitrospirota bacterium]